MNIEFVVELAHAASQPVTVVVHPENAQAAPATVVEPRRLWPITYLAFNRRLSTILSLFVAQPFKLSMGLFNSAVVHDHEHCVYPMKQYNSRVMTIQIHNINAKAGESQCKEEGWHCIWLDWFVSLINFESWRISSVFDLLVQFNTDQFTKQKQMKKLMHEQNRLWDYEVLRELGKGEYGQVYQVRLKKDNKIYALKKINTAGSHEKIQAFRQIKALKLISHPSIIEYHDSFLSMENIYIVTEFAEKGDLGVEIANRIKQEKKYTEDQLWSIFQSLIEAIKCLHEKHILHRDLKIENIFQTAKGKFKVGDLGMSKIVYDNNQLLSTRVGTPIYFAPEIVQHKLYSFPVDIWALGCVFYYMAALEHPFKDATIETLGYYIIDKDPRPIKGPYSPQLISFIWSFLDKNPQTRPTIHDIYRKLKERKEQKIFNKVSVFNLRQILSLKAQHLEETKKKQSQKQKQDINEVQSPMQPRLMHRNYHRRVNQSLEIDDNPERIKQDIGSRRNMSLILSKIKKSVEKQVECFSPMIKSNGFSIQMNSPDKNKGSQKVRMEQTVRYRNKADLSFSLNEDNNSMVEFPRKARARGDLT